MQIEIQFIHFETDEELIKEATGKLSKLEKLYDRIEKCSIIFKKENSDDKKKYFAEVRLAVPKDDLFASEKADSFGRALDRVTNDLKKQLVKHKEKIQKFDRVKTVE